MTSGWDWYLTPTEAKLVVDENKAKPTKKVKVKDPQVAKEWAVERYTNFSAHTFTPVPHTNYPYNHCDLNMPQGKCYEVSVVVAEVSTGGDCPHWLCQHHYDLLKAVGESDTGFEALVAEYYGD